MIRINPLHFPAAILVLLYSAAWPAARLFAQDAAGSRVAIINLRLACDNLQVTIDSQHEKAILQRQLDQLVIDHKAVLQGSDSKASAEDLDQQRVEFDAQEKELQVRILRLQARQLKRSFDLITSAVRDLAVSKGIDLVLVFPAIQLPQGTEDLNPQTVAGLVFNRSVLYASDGIDLTPAVIQRCNRKATRVPNFPSSAPSPTTLVKIGSRTFKLEIARDDASREHGLMERDEMETDHGMIFAFPDEVMRSFWMHHTRFPLDILYLDGHGKIVSFHSMKAYDETADSSDFPARYAIELNAGQAAAAGVKAGDVVHLPDIDAVPASKRR